MADIASPCIKVCAIDPLSALCVGCGRTLAEIERWARYSPDERRRIMGELAARLARAGVAQKPRVDVS
jgi:uncharacterized protein